MSNTTPPSPPLPFTLLSRLLSHPLIFICLAIWFSPHSFNPHPPSHRFLSSILPCFTFPAFLDLTLPFNTALPPCHYTFTSPIPFHFQVLTLPFIPLIPLLEHSTSSAIPSLFPTHTSPSTPSTLFSHPSTIRPFPSLPHLPSSSLTSHLIQSSPFSSPSLTISSHLIHHPFPFPSSSSLTFV